MKEQNCLKVVWAGDQHTSLIDEAMLRNHATGENSKSGKIIWNRMLQPEMCFFSWEAVKTDPRARLEWLETVRDYGFAGLNGVGQHEAGLEEVMALIGLIREPNFGRIFDVKAKKNPSNLSDTHYSLPPRTENPYRDPPPGLHVLSCLQPAAKGGETILVDGAFILQKVRKRNPPGYQMLSEVPVKFQYQDDDVWLENKRCLLEFHPDGSLRSLAFNNRSVDPFSLPSAQQESWFKAYRSLERELLASQNQLRVQLQPGQLLLIDNRRVLHGQSTFSAYSIAT